MRIAAAQTLSQSADLAANVAVHVHACATAAAHGAGLVVFPELSLSGYELRLLRDCVLTPDHPVLDPLRQAAVQHGMLIVAGAPVPSEDGRGISIGAITLLPDGSAGLYRKRFLHQGEQPFAVAGSELAHVQRAGAFQAALAICADTTHEEHPAAAQAGGADLYLAGVLWTPGGYDVDAAMMERYARTYGLACLVANHAGPSGGFPSAGRSAFWAPGGRLLATAPDQGGALVLAGFADGVWEGAALPLGHR
jgi:predicted amidohydrolase